MSGRHSTRFAVVVVVVCVVAVAQGATLTSVVDGTSTDPSFDAATSFMTTAGFNRACFSLSTTAVLSALPTRDHDRFLYGTDVTLICTAKSDHGSKPRLFIRQCNTGPSDFYSDSRIDRAELVVGNVSSNTRLTDLMFGCWQINHTCTESETRPLGQFEPQSFDCFRHCMTGCSSVRTIYFGHGPPSPTGFRCVSDSWNGLSCSWNVRSGTGDTKWSVTYLPPCDDVATKANCTALHQPSDSNTFPLTCVPVTNQTVHEGDSQTLVCTVDQHWFHREVTFYFQVVGKNLFDEIRQNFSVETSTSIVKFSKVTSLQLTTDDGNSTVLNVTWHKPPFVDGMPRLECSITMRTPCGRQPAVQQRNVSVPADDCNNDQTIVSGLRAHTCYTVQVHIRPQGGSWWSDSVTVSSTTPEGLPSVAPGVTPGGHMTWRCGSTRCLMLYWQPITPEARNGELTGYELTVKQNTHIQGQEVQTNFTQPILDGTAVSVSIGQLSNSSAHACISGATSVGVSPQAGCIFVPSVQDPLIPASPDEVYVERAANNETYLVSWDPVIASFDDVTVFWCQGPIYDADTEHVSCKVSMHWANLSHKATNYTVDVSGTDDRPGYKWYFGVAFTRGQLSRGMTWNRCVYNYHGTVSSAPSPFASIVNKTEVRVTWDFKLCDVAYLGGRPLVYQINYTLQTSGNSLDPCSNGNITNITPTPGVNSHVLRDLVPDATYWVCMRIVTRTGGSDVSTPIPVSLKQVEAPKVYTGSDNFPLLLGVSIATGLVGLALTATFVCMCRSRVRRVLRKVETACDALPKPNPRRRPMKSDTSPPPVSARTFVKLQRENELTHGNDMLEQEEQRYDGHSQAVEDQENPDVWTTQTEASQLQTEANQVQTEASQLQNEASQVQINANPLPRAVRTCNDYTLVTEAQPLPTVSVDQGEPPQAGHGAEMQNQAADSPSLPQTNHRPCVVRGDYVSVAGVDSGDSNSVKSDRLAGGDTSAQAFPPPSLDDLDQTRSQAPTVNHVLFATHRASDTTPPFSGTSSGEATGMENAPQGDPVQRESLMNGSYVTVGSPGAEGSWSHGHRNNHLGYISHSGRSGGSVSAAASFASSPNCLQQGNGHHVQNVNALSSTVNIDHSQGQGLVAGSLYVSHPWPRCDREIQGDFADPESDSMYDSQKYSFPDLSSAASNTDSAEDISTISGQGNNDWDICVETHSDISPSCAEDVKLDSAHDALLRRDITPDDISAENTTQAEHTRPVCKQNMAYVQPCENATSKPEVTSSTEKRPSPTKSGGVDKTSGCNAACSNSPIVTTTAAAADEMITDGVTLSHSQAVVSECPNVPSKSERKNPISTVPLSRSGGAAFMIRTTSSQRPSHPNHNTSSGTVCGLGSPYVSQGGDNRQHAGDVPRGGDIPLITLGPVSGGSSPPNRSSAELKLAFSQHSLSSESGYVSWEQDSNPQ